MNPRPRLFDSNECPPLRALKRRRLFESDDDTPQHPPRAPEPSRNILQPHTVVRGPTRPLSVAAGIPADVEMTGASSRTNPPTKKREAPITEENLAALNQRIVGRGVSTPPKEASKKAENVAVPVTASLLQMLTPPDVSLPPTEAGSDSDNATERAPTPPNVLLDANIPHIPGDKEGMQRVLREREAERSRPFIHDGAYGGAVDIDDLGLDEPPRKKMRFGSKQAKRTDEGPPTAHVSAALRKIVEVSRQEIAGKIIVPEIILSGTAREKNAAQGLETMTLVLDRHSKKPILSVEAQQLVRFLLTENERLQGLFAQKRPPSRKEMEAEGTRARRACRMLASEIADHILQPEGYNLVWESDKHQQKQAAMRVIEDVFYDIKLLPRTEASEDPKPSQSVPKSNPN